MYYIYTHARIHSALEPVLGRIGKQVQRIHKYTHTYIHMNMSTHVSTDI